LIPSLLDGLGMGVGFTAALLSMGIIRELFGNGTFFSIPLLKGFIDPVIIFILPPGGFFVFGMLIALSNKISSRNKLKQEKNIVDEINCSSCTMSKTCQKV